MSAGLIIGAGAASGITPSFAAARSAAASADPTTTVIVHPSDMAGWKFINDTTDGLGSGKMVTGPGTTPAGLGSASLATVASSGQPDRQTLMTAAYAGTRLSSINTLDYWTTAMVGDLFNPSLGFDVRFHPGDTGYQGRLNAEPSPIGTTPGSGWQHWDALGGNWYASNVTSAGSNGDCPQVPDSTHPACTWADVLRIWPLATIWPTGNLVLRAGAPTWPAGAYNVDALTVGIDHANTLYDFEATTAPAFTADTPPTAVLGAAYSYTFAATGDPVPTFSVGSGTLPSGLTLDPTTGVLSGTAGTGTFTVSATNSRGTVSSTPIVITDDPPAGGSSATTPNGAGYWSLSDNGTLSAHGDAANLGSENGVALNAPVVAVSSTATGDGYWLVGADGGVFTFGDAAFHGSLGAVPLNEPIVGVNSTTDGAGYWLVAADGGMFTFGNAQFSGSMGSTPLNKPIVGLSATANGEGYSLVASDGGVFTFGNAPFYGSMAATPLNGTVVGIVATPNNLGYWLVAADGGVFSFGDAKFFGSLGGTGAVVTGMLANGNDGYRLITSSGAVHSFGVNN